MLKIISSKNENEIHSLAKKEKDIFEQANNLKVGSFLDCEINESEVISQNVSIFGDKNAYILRVSKQDELELVGLPLFLNLEKSQHFFVLVGNGVEFEKKVGEVLEDKELKKIKIQKIVEKAVFDFPAALVAALQKHDKKNSWDLLLKELAKKDAEPIHGSCVFAYKSLLVYLNDPKKNSPQSGVKDFSWKQAAANAKLGKRERGEVVDKYFNLILTYHKARMGKGNLASQLESWVLEN